MKYDTCIEFKCFRTIFGRYLVTYQIKCVYAKKVLLMFTTHTLCSEQSLANNVGVCQGRGEAIDLTIEDPV